MCLATADWGCGSDPKTSAETGVGTADVIGPQTGGLSELGSSVPMIRSVARGWLSSQPAHHRFQCAVAQASIRGQSRTVRATQAVVPWSDTTFGADGTMQAGAPDRRSDAITCRATGSLADTGYP